MASITSPIAADFFQRRDRLDARQRRIGRVGSELALGNQAVERGAELVRWPVVRRRRAYRTACTRCPACAATCAMPTPMMPAPITRMSVLPRSMAVMAGIHGAGRLARNAAKPSRASSLPRTRLMVCAVSSRTSGVIGPTSSWAKSCLISRCALRAAGQQFRHAWHRPRRRAIERHHLLHQADGQRLGGADARGRQRQALGLALADSVDDVGADHGRQDAEPGFADRESWRCRRRSRCRRRRPGRRRRRAQRPARGPRSASGTSRCAPAWRQSAARRRGSTRVSRHSRAASTAGRRRR